ncbi:peptidyl-prolyl cis-trans isomerase FKBP17-1, chloroplastic isoform X2 [Manihot esculenta]|uniref:peptidyl-prolyl cis-trans isomerase FKBP17-1, chloroplastic isoform X2 n=1 Tax=Manihot esculenta TaxID=3983 RepID=UPI000B5D746A|nr:peptidyl-prolyl cis-trans isomerase FKBP17-1, chloroplastic isoform X2 [Manihot esculenta]XP_043807541.1 peptidyl-prolyl cis-trans isomerase FKBP17-1, chloroplastic isoform X2 [Manihot esculenta]
MALNYFASTVFIHATHNHVALLPAPSSSPEPLKARRRALLSNVSLVSISAAFSTSTIPFPFSAAASSRNEFSELPNSGGVKALDLRIGSGDVPVDGDQVAIHYYGRLAAKQGWRFDSTYDHKDETNEPIPFVFVLGSGKISISEREEDEWLIYRVTSDSEISTIEGVHNLLKNLLRHWIHYEVILISPLVFVKVISGIEIAVKSMKVGGIRRVIIPPSQGYQNTSQEPIPPNAKAFHNHFQSNASCQRRRLDIGYSHI